MNEIKKLKEEITGINTKVQSLLKTLNEKYNKLQSLELSNNTKYVGKTYKGYEDDNDCPYIYLILDVVKDNRYQMKTLMINYTLDERYPHSEVDNKYWFSNNIESNKLEIDNYEEISEIEFMDIFKKWQMNLNNLVELVWKNNN